MGLSLIFANPIGSAARTHSFAKNKRSFVLYSSEMPSSQESQLLSASAALRAIGTWKPKTRVAAVNCHSGLVTNLFNWFHAWSNHCIPISLGSFRIFTIFENCILIVAHNVFEMHAR